MVQREVSPSYSTVYSISPNLSLLLLLIFISCRRSFTAFDNTRYPGRDDGNRHSSRNQRITTRPDPEHNVRARDESLDFGD